MKKRKEEDSRGSNQTRIGHKSVMRKGIIRIILIRWKEKEEVIIM